MPNPGVPLLHESLYRVASLLLPGNSERTGIVFLSFEGLSGQGIVSGFTNELDWAQVDSLLSICLIKPFALSQWDAAFTGFMLANICCLSSCERAINLKEMHVCLRNHYDILG